MSLGVTVPNRLHDEFRDKSERQKSALRTSLILNRNKATVSC
jgi:hypothetical protein